MELPSGTLRCRHRGNIWLPVNRGLTERDVLAFPQKRTRHVGKLVAKLDDREFAGPPSTLVYGSHMRAPRHSRAQA